MDFYIYLLKASLLLGLFLLIYEIFLKKETFFQINRIYLLMGIGCSLILPAIYIKSETSSAIHVSEYLESIKIEGISPTGSTNSAIGDSLSILSILLGIYISGILFLGIRFIIGFLHLYRLFRNSVKVKSSSRINFRETQEEVGPFSLFNQIVYNPALHHTDDLDNIIHHEIAHVRQNHSLDILCSQLFCTLLWFNPLVWCYHRRIVRNAEFQADALAALHQDSLKNYQYSLIRTSLPNNQYLPTTNFYQSFLKTRIMMLQKQQSKRLSILKTGLILPLLAAFLFGFQVQVQAQEETEQVPFSTIDDAPIYPGCEEFDNHKDRKNCMSQKIQQFVSENFEYQKILKDSSITGTQRISVQFTINENGKVEDVLTRSDKESLKREAKRVISLIPEMKPGKVDNQAVRVVYQLPIIFQADEAKD